MIKKRSQFTSYIFLFLFNLLSFLVVALFGANMSIQKNENLSQMLVSAKQENNESALIIDYRVDRINSWVSDSVQPKLDVLNRFRVDFKENEITSTGYYVKNQKSNPAVFYEGVTKHEFSVLNIPSLDYIGLNTIAGIKTFSQLKTNEIAISRATAQKMLKQKTDDISTLIGTNVSLFHIQDYKTITDDYKISAIFEDDNNAKKYSVQLDSDFIVMPTIKVLPGINGVLFEVNKVTIDVVQRLLSYINKYLAIDQYYYNVNDNEYFTVNAGLISGDTRIIVDTFNDSFLYYFNKTSYIVDGFLLMFTIVFCLFSLRIIKLTSTNFKMKLRWSVLTGAAALIISYLTLIILNNIKMGKAILALHNLYSFMFPLIILIIFLLYAFFLGRKILKQESLLNLSKSKIIQQVPNKNASSGLTTDLMNMIKSKTITETYDFEVASSPNTKPFASFKYYYKDFRRSNANIVLIRGAGLESLWPLLAAKLTGKRTLLALHGMWSDLVYMNKFKRILFANVIERLIFSLADYYYTVYEGATKKKIPFFYKDKYLGTVYNPVQETLLLDDSTNELDDYKKAGKIIGLYVGRLSREKGLEYLFIALSEYYKQNRNSEFILVLIGNGNDKDLLQRKIVDLNLSDKVVFLGEKNSINAYMNKCDFVVLPTLHENHPNVILEACKAHKYIITTAVGGIVETVTEGRNVRFVKPKSVIELLDALKDVIINKRYEQIDASYFDEIANRFSYENFENKLLSVLSKVEDN